MGRVAPAEGDVAVFERNESVVGDGDAMGVGAEITQGMFGASERSLGVDDPDGGTVRLASTDAADLSPDAQDLFFRR